MQVVPRVDLVHRDRAERRPVEVPEVLLLALRRPSRLDLGQVVVGPDALGLERARAPDAGERPAAERRGRADVDRVVLGHRDEPFALDERPKRLHLPARLGDDLARSRVIRLQRLPRLERIAVLDAAGRAPERLLRLAQLALGDVDQLVEGHVDALVEPQLLDEHLRPEPERPARLGQRVGLELGRVDVNGLDRFRRGVREVAQHRRIVEVPQRPRHVALDEGDQPPQRLDGRLDEQARRILDVLPRRVQERRHLAQLRDQPAAALVRRRVVEHDLAGERRRQRVGVELRAPLVRADALELEEPGVDVLLHRRAIEPIVEAQGVRPDAGQPAGKAAQLADLAIERRAREVLDVVVERVHPVERRGRRPQLVQVAEIVVDEVLNGFERVHGRAGMGGSGRGPALPGTVGRGKRSHIKWYNNGGPY